MNGWGEELGHEIGERGSRRPASDEQSWPMLIFESLSAGGIAVLLVLVLALVLVGIYAGIVWPLTNGTWRRPTGKIPLVGESGPMADFRRRIGDWILVFQRGGISGKAGSKSGKHAASDRATPVCGSGRRGSAIAIALSGILAGFGNWL